MEGSAFLLFLSLLQFLLFMYDRSRHASRSYRYRGLGLTVIACLCAAGKKPSVAAIQGLALGGGLELTMVRQLCCCPA
jgi:hypothetical protein